MISSCPVILDVLRSSGLQWFLFGEAIAVRGNARPSLDCPNHMRSKNIS
jgi:hypothetical protein